MSIAVSFDKVSYSGLLNGFSSEIISGSCALMTTEREEESCLLASLMTGMKLPDSGFITVSGRITGESTPEELLQLRSRLGVVPPAGGLVSNLKVWENIFLPYLYHRGEPAVEDEESADSYLGELGYTSKKMALPAHLTLYEKRVVAFVRAAVMKPDIMIYCNIFDKMTPAQQAGLSQAAAKFHSESAGRTSIFLASSHDVPFTKGFDALIPIHGH